MTVIIGMSAGAERVESVESVESEYAAGGVDG